MRKIIFLLALIFPLAVNAGNDTYFSDIYQKTKEASHNTAIQRMFVQLEISSSDIEGFLNGSINEDDAIEYCGKWGYPLHLLNICISDVGELYESEKSLAQIENSEREMVLSSEIWSNGTLADSDFDIIVDFNIIDIIYFGDGANIPNSRIFNPWDDDGSGSGNGGDDDGSGVGGGDGGGEDSGGGDGGGGGDDDGGGDGDGDGDGDGGDDYSDYSCSDPDVLWFENLDDGQGNSTYTDGDNSWNNDNSNSGNNNYNNTNNYDYSNINNISNFVGGEYPQFSEETATCDGDEYAMYGQSFCVPKYCDDIFCLTIELKNNTSPGSSTDNCIKCLTDKGDSVIDEAYRQKERLNPTENTTVHWFGRDLEIGTFRIEMQSFEKPSLDTNPSTKDGDKSLAQEIRSIQNNMVLSGATADTDDDKMVDNRKLLDAILSVDCRSFISRIPERTPTDTILQECEKEKENLGYPLSFYKRDLISAYKGQVIREKETEKKSQYWAEMVNQFHEFSAIAFAIDKSFVNLTPVQEIKEKMKDCKSQ